MQEKYLNWIRDYVNTHETWNQCDLATKDMVNTFPELTRIRGQVLLSNGWFRDHWWLVDEGIHILDVPN